MSEVVSYERRGSVGVVVVDYPPVNALSAAVRAGILEGVKQGLADAEASAIVLHCAGRTFLAGADITEFGKKPQPPSFEEMLEVIEGADKPVVAALHGTALGGGLETALTCHYRVAVPKAKVGLPEVNLGLIPGAGGTQRLPRVAGVEAALELCVLGAPVGAKRALTLGVVDEIIEGDLLDGACAWAEKLVQEKRPLVKIRDRECSADPQVFEAFVAKVGKQIRGFDARAAAIEAVRAATTLPFDEGMKKERELFNQLMDGSQSMAQRYLFFSEREVAKIPDVPKGTPTRDIAKVAVVGAGTMGGGIAMAFADGGVPVRLLEVDEAALERGIGVIRKNYEASVTRGRLTEDQAKARVDSIRPSLDYADLADADLVIEAVFEDMEVKRQVFAKLDEVCKPGAILATNTSTLDVDAIASGSAHPERVLGMHFFSPANVMKLVEVVRGAATDKEVLATAMGLVKRLRKVGVAVGVCFGFVGNRMLFHYTREARFLLEEGASPEQVDRVLSGFGMPMGPLQMSDLAGLDVMYRIRQSPEGRPVEGERDSKIGDMLFEAGRLGQKSGAGFYRYEGRKAVADPEVEKMIEQCAREAGIERREISDEEILQRCLYPVINEGAKILQEGIALRPCDIDVIWIYGYGFPRYHGGPMCYADVVGLGRVVAGLEALAEKHGKLFEPAPLLKKLAAEGKKLSSWRRS